MFRPRRPGPLRGRGLGRPRPGPRVQQALRLFEEGHYQQAGELFGQLADAARDARQPIRAAHLAAQAGRAFLEAGDVERATDRARQAIRQFVLGRKPGQAVRTLQGAAIALRAKGFNAQADALEQKAQARLAEIGMNLANQQAHGRLPSTCPQCGGPLRSDEVDWVDSSSAECPYCGVLVATAS